MEINPSSTPFTEKADCVLTGAAGEVLAELLQLLPVQPDSSACTP
jgi:hypothetical protein